MNNGNIGGGGNNIVNNRPVNINNANLNQANFNRPSYGYQNGWYHGNWGWGGGAWPAAWFAGGALTGAAAAWAWGPSQSYAYSNPYYVADAGVPVGLDYSQPIATGPIDQTALAAQAPVDPC